MTAYEEILESAKRLSSTERMQLADALLALEQSSDELFLSETQRQELDRRVEEMDRDDNLGIPWEEVMNQIRKRA
jgi:putative addiction module component (TIGR02574 family)